MNPDIQRTTQRFPPGRRTMWMSAAILAVTLLAYAPALRGAFIWDDYDFLVHNPLIEARDGLRRFWFTTDAPDYFPLASSALWVQRRLWGLDPAGYHLVNILLHGINAILLWRVLRRLNIPGAWLAGMIFAVHPVAVATTAWITEIKNLLPTALCLLSLLAWLEFDDKGSRRWYLLALGLFLLGLLAKTSIVILPFVLLLLAWWRRGAVSRKDLAAALPFFALSLAFGMVTIWFQSHNAIRGLAVRPEGIFQRVAAAGWIVWFYLYKVILPINLCAIYPRWTISARYGLSLLPLLFLAALVALLWIRRKRWGRGPLFALSYFVIALLPVLGFVNMLFMGLSLVADHLQYTAMVGIIALAAALLARAAECGGRAGRMGLCASAACVAALAVLTWNRAYVYADEKRLWMDNLQKAPAATAAWNGLGNVYVRSKEYEDAIRCFDKAVEDRPGYALPLWNRANTYALLGQYDKAINDYSAAIISRPNYVEAYRDRGLALAHLRRLDEAAGDFTAVIALRPEDPSAYVLRGTAHYQMGRYDLALSDFDKAVGLSFDYAAAYSERANALAALRRMPEAMRDYDTAIALKPGAGEGYYLRGNAYASANRFQDALRDYDRAAELKKDFAQVYINRAIVRLRLRQYDKAREDLRTYQDLGGQPRPEIQRAIERGGAGPD